MGRLRGFYASMIGKKVVMGVTGLIGIGSSSSTPLEICWSSAGRKLRD